MKTALRRMGALTGRNLREILREPLSLVFLLAMPLAMLVLFYYAFHDLTAQFEMRYLAPGLVVFSQSFLTLFTGLLISVDRGSDFLTRLYVTPARAHEFVLSYLTAMLPVGLAQSAVFLLTAGLLDPDFFSVRLLVALPASLVTALFFIGFGMLMGSLCSEKAIGGVASIVIAGQSVLSGMWFPLEGLSDGFVGLMNVLPFRPAAQWLQGIVTGTGDAEGGRHLLILIGYTVAVTALGVFAFWRQRSKN